jgi:NAD(P)H-hydrate repair Nnr-like enzyme with NAD(P)H-hydrate dehydratase domain
MLLAALAVSGHLGVEPPQALLGGDIGRGDGTRRVYEHLHETVLRERPDVVAFHYLQPIMSLMRECVGKLLALTPRPLLVADAGAMYAAKASGVGSAFELMTPDVGEVGFLADPAASHPAYVARHLFGACDFDPQELARQAHELGASARVLLVKGQTDHVAVEGEIVARTDSPSVPCLEAIGGTGDTITGLAAGLMSAGFPTPDAAICATRVNRRAGALLGARPDQTAADLAARFPEVLAADLCALSLGGPSTT